MKNKDTNKQEKKFPVREGGEDSSILHNKKPPAKDSYPQPEEKDKQQKAQPEFTEEQPNRKSPNTPGSSKKIKSTLCDLSGREPSALAW